jgi:DNA-binding protein YbaB
MDAAGVTAEDSSGCVHATADATGRVSGIEISTSWRTKLGAERICQALTEASLRAALASVRASKPSSGSEQRPESDNGAKFEGLSAEAADEVLFRAAEDLRSARIRIMEQRERRRELATTPFRGSDERHRVTVTLDFSGAVMSVSADEEWLASASTERLTGAIREAFESAYQAIDITRREA